MCQPRRAGETLTEEDRTMAKKRKVYWLDNGIVRYWSVRWNRYTTAQARLIKERDFDAMSVSDQMRCRSWPATMGA